MNDVQVFNNPLFGDLRTIIINGKEYFFGVDIAEKLMYKRPRKAVTDNCNGVLGQDTIKNDGGYPEPLIPEGDVYRLIIKAGQQGNSEDIKRKADELERWIFDEVLPNLRKTGSYGLSLTTEQQIQLLAKGNVELNQKVDNLSGRMDAVEKELPLLPVDADRISNAVKAKGAETLGGKESKAYHNKSLCQNVYASIYGNLKYNFGITGTYKKLKRSQTDKALEIVRNYQPPLYLKDRIENENSGGQEA